MIEWWNARDAIAGFKNEVFDLVDASWLCGRNDCK